MGNTCITKCNLKIEEQIRNDLFAMQDKEYHAFHSKLIPNVNPDVIIGVRTPALRKYAKKLSKTSQAEEYLTILPHTYYDENNLHGFLIEEIRDYTAAINALDAFLPYVDNWATCDMMSPKIFKQHLPELIIKIKDWINTDHTYTKRFGMCMLMKFYLDENFKVEYLDMVASVRSNEYYVNMMVAWFFATALAKQYDATLPYIEQCRLDKWVHNKAIQKANESYRITSAQKAYLKTLKLK